MYIHGEYRNAVGEVIEVHLLTGGDRTEDVVIGDESSGVFFTDDPVETESQTSDTFDVLLRTQARIRLLTRRHMGELFAARPEDVAVNIYRDGECVFAGYVEPMALQQGYNEDLDEVELCCIDCLCALEYRRYRNIGDAGTSYADVKASAVQRTFGALLREMVDGVTSDMDIKGSGVVRLLYDGSKWAEVTDEERYGIMDRLAVSELLFLGDDEDEVWKQDEVMEELLKYLNLHVVQEGFTFRIFAWETVACGSGKMAEESEFCDLLTMERSSMERNVVRITPDIVDGCDATLTIGEVYNQLLLTCSIEEMENVVESPLDSDLLEDPYSRKQKYMTELSSEGTDKNALYHFGIMVLDEETNYSKGSITDWYIRMKRNWLWRFPVGGDMTTDWQDSYAGGTQQHDVAMRLGSKMGGCLMAWGKQTFNTAQTDNSKLPRIPMTSSLMLSVNGNGVDNDIADSRLQPYPNDDDLKACVPFAVYDGNAAGGVFSPVDEDVRNYIVISGTIVLNPIMHESGNYSTLKMYAERDELDTHCVPVASRNGGGRYYTRKYWVADDPKEEPESALYHTGLYPSTGDGLQLYEFKYSAIGDSTDKVSKVAVLACMLIIGDKCVVENQESSNGLLTDFEWRRYKSREECETDDEYYSQCFYIGFDPKIGDKLIGTEFKIQTNFEDADNVGADEGMAIPITRADALSGQVKFMILGPVNTTWDEYTRRHPSFWRHTKWTTTSVSLLAHTSSIVVKDFEVKIYAGGEDQGEDNDVVYMSDTVERFVNRKDDLEMKINSALTSEECARLGVRNTVKISTPVDTSTGNGVTEIYDRHLGQTAKAEQIYVDAYWHEYHEPRMILEQRLTDKAGTVDLLNHYTEGASGKEFYVQAISRNLTQGTATMTLKEVWND